MVEDENVSQSAADADPSVAFVLVQHLVPDRKSILSDLIRRFTRMQVFEVVLSGSGSDGTQGVRAIKAEGGPFWNDLTISPVRDVAGKLTHFIGVTRDVTDIKQASKQLSESEMRMRLAIRSGDLGLWDWQVATGHLTVNDQWLLMLGLDAQTHNPTIEQWLSLVHPDDSPKLDRLFKEVISNPAGCELEVEIRARHKNGNYIWILDKGRVVERAPDGSPLRVVGTHLDITLRKQAEIELRASEVRFRTLVEHSPNCIHEIDLAGRLTSMNRAGLKMLRADDVCSIQGMPYLDAVGDSDRERIAGLLADAIAGKASEFVFQTNNGLIFQSSFVPIADDTGTVKNLMGLTIDITARKHAEMVDSFLAQAGVSAHDNSFFPALARFLATSLQMDYVCIDQFDDDGLNATTLTVWHDNQFRDNVTYALSDTPCGVVFERGNCCYPSNVQHFFPKDLMLQELLAESYFGITLMSHTGKPIGLIAAIGRRKIDNQALAEATLARVASRAAGELERLQAESVIAQTTEILERTGELAKIGGWSVNLKTMKLSWTRETFHIADIEPPIEPSFDDGINLFAPVARPTIAAAVRAAIEAGTPFDLELPLITAKGRHRWVHTQGFAEMKGGKPMRIYGTLQDITERKLTQQSLVANEARFRAIIDASPVPMAINDDEMRITLLNPAFVRTFGYDLTDIPTLADWWPKAYPDPVYRQWVIDTWQTELAQAAQTKKEFIPLEVRTCCKDGTDRFVMASAAPLGADFGQTHLVILYDISERKRAEQSLKLAHSVAEVASRAKSEFLANMSHEIRTPLTAILGFAEILGENATVDQTPERRNQIVDTIKSAGSHLLAVINDILDLSKIEADKLTVEQIDTPLINILCDVERLMLQTAAGKGLVLSFALSSPLPDRILCDPTRVRQILMNLVGNAIKFTEAGNVTVTAGANVQDEKSRLVIDIADTGPGMTPEQALGLFTAFGQADSSVTRKHGGSGLGLVISQRLANMLGGDVSLLYSEAGKGSCFRLVLPLEQVAGSAMVKSLTPIQVHDEPKPIAIALTLSGRVLLAEDGLDNQRLIAFIIRKAGATIETADNGRIALDMLDQAEAAGTPFDMLLTDMQMPEMDGYSLASTLRYRGFTLPIVALTAHAMADDRKKCIDAGCDDYVSKPIDKANLIATCAAWMGKPGIRPCRRLHAEGSDHRFYEAIRIKSMASERVLTSNLQSIDFTLDD